MAGTIFNQLQRSVSEFREAQNIYWADLQLRISRLQAELISYLGVSGMTLRFEENDVETPIVVVGNINGNSIQPLPSIHFKKDEEKLTLDFGVRIYLSRENSELVDLSLTFPCSAYKKGDDYFVYVTDREIACRKASDKLDFTLVFDYMVERLKLHVDKSEF